MFRLALCSALLAATAFSAPAVAQSHEVDLAIGYTGVHGTGSHGSSFWQQGGTAELSVDLLRGLGAAGEVTGARAKNISGNGVNLTTLTEVFGPRYTIHRGRVGVFGDALFGASQASDSVFPGNGAAQSTASTFAVQVGGGVDLRASRHIAVRALEASWLRTGFPNGASNAQNSLVITSGIVLRFGR